MFGKECNRCHARRSSLWHQMRYDGHRIYICDACSISFGQWLITPCPATVLGDTRTSVHGGD